MPTLSIDIEAKLASFQDSLGRVERQVGGLSGRLESAFSGLTSTLSTLAGVAGVGALGALVKNSIDAADELGKLSQRVGVTVESLSELQYAGKLAGVGNDQLAEGLKKLSVNLQSAAEGNKGLRASFAAVGISIEELGTLRADEAVTRIAEAFSRMEDGARKTALATELGGRSFSQWIPLLNQGAGGLRDAADEARRFGVVVDTETARAAERFNDNLTRLGAGASALGISLANKVLPLLTRFTDQLIEGQRIAGSFASALALFGTINPFKSDASNLKSVRKELDELTAARDRYVKSNADTSAIDRAIASLTKKLEYLKFLERQALSGGGEGNFDARDRRLTDRTPAPAAEVAETLNKAIADPDNTERAARRFTQIYLDQFQVLAKRGREYQEALLEQFEEGNRATEKASQQFQSRIDGIVGQTTSGRVAAVFKDIEALNDALIAGNEKVTPEVYTEALEVLQKKLNDIRGISTDTFEQFRDDGTQALRDLQFAVEGWGRDFTNTLADAVETGKLNFSDLVRSILRDLVRLQIQQSITRPLFNALSGALSGVNFFGSSGGGSGIGYGGGQGLQLSGARANGGPVSAGRAYLVGERGPEVLIPRMSGTVLPNGVGMGGGVTQVFNISPGIDAGTVYRAAQMGATMAKSDIARSMRIGEVG